MKAPTNRSWEVEELERSSTDETKEARDQGQKGLVARAVTLCFASFAFETGGAEAPLMKAEGRRERWRGPWGGEKKQVTDQRKGKECDGKG